MSIKYFFKSYENMTCIYFSLSIGQELQIIAKLLDRKYFNLNVVKLINSFIYLCFPCIQ